MKHGLFGAAARLALIPLVLTLPACDEIIGGDEKDLDPALVGEWVALSALITSTENSSDQFDLISDGGGFMALGLDDDGVIAIREWDAEGDVFEDDAGTWFTDGSTLVIAWNGETGQDTVTYQITGGRLVVNVGEEDMDLDGDGMDEVGTFVITFASADDSPEPNLVGSWEASALVFTSMADPGTSADVIQAGATFSLTANLDGSYTVVQTYPDGAGGTVTETENGTYVGIDGLLWAGETGTMEDLALLFYSVDGGTLTLTHVWDESFDFDDDGFEEPAVMTITLSQQ